MTEATREAANGNGAATACLGEGAVRNLHQIHVLWPDCDPAGILFYGNYFRWMDDATYFLFKQAGLHKEHMLAEYGVPGMPLVNANADFRSPAKFGQVLTVESFVSEAGRSSFTVKHIFRENDRVTAEGVEKRIWCTADPEDPAKITAQPIPQPVRNALGVG